MTLGSREHDELIQQFERDSRQRMPSAAVAKEPRELWKNGHVYQDGHTNQLFVAYSLGHAYGIAEARWMENRLAYKLAYKVVEAAPHDSACGSARVLLTPDTDSWGFGPCDCWKSRIGKVQA